MPYSLQEAYLEVANEYLQQGRIDSIRISTRPDELSADQLNFLIKRGVKTIEIGVQSLSDRVLEVSCRGYTVKQAVASIREVKRAGFETGVQIMTGLPEDSGVESLETVDVLCGLKPDFARIYPLLVFRDTELAKRMQEGQYKPPTLEAAVDTCVRLLERFEKAAIPVIRIGLQGEAGMETSEGGILAGPYHPAFGSLVRSELFFRKLLSALPEPSNFVSTVRIRIHPHDRPLLSGDRGENYKRLQEVIGKGRFIIQEDRTHPRGGVTCASA